MPNVNSALGNEKIILLLLLSLTNDDILQKSHHLHYYYLMYLYEFNNCDFNKKKFKKIVKNSWHTKMILFSECYGFFTFKTKLLKSQIVAFIVTQFFFALGVREFLNNFSGMFFICFQFP